MPWLAAGQHTRELRDGGDLVVGGGSEAAWRIPSVDLMPRHFVVTLSADRVTVRPFNADNVVVVNDVQLSGEPHALRDGDVIAAGSGRFVYSDGPPRPQQPPPQSEQSAYLIDVRGNTAHRLTNRSTGIGRDASNAVVVRDPTASRFHAEIRREAGGFALHPRGSAGTLVNGRRVGTPGILSEGDTIEIAYRVLQFTTKPLESGLTVAGAEAAPSDDLSRRPTIPRDQTPGSLLTIDPPRSRSIAGTVAIVAVVVAVAALVAWWVGRG